MNIEIPDEKARTTLEGLRAGDPTVITYLIQVLGEEVQGLETHPIEVFERGQLRGHWRSIEAIREEYDLANVSKEDRAELKVHDRLRDITLEGEEIWEIKRNE